MPVELCVRSIVKGCDKMKIILNEQEIQQPDGISLFKLRDQINPHANLIVLNGMVQTKDIPLKEGDHLHFIVRGEMPSEKELEGLMMARHTPGIHKKIKKACVGIAGLGGLGSSVAIALARIGVGKLILVDFDVVEPSNLNRQQYFVDQIGKPKTEALLENLKRINPYVEYQIKTLRLTRENSDQIFNDAEIVVEAFDRADQKAMLLESISEKPIVGASGVAGFGSEKSIQVRKIGSYIYLVGDFETAATPGCGLMAPRVGIVSHIQANLVLQEILKS